jgi:hypothetical protein
VIQLNEVIQRLRELNEPVPKPLCLPTEGEVTALEKRLGVTFHPDYRRFLVEASDVVYGTLEPATITLPGSHTDLARVCDGAWNAMGVPKNLLPICEDNGDYYCMNAGGQVVFWSHNGASDEKWPDLAAWIEEVWLGE